MKISVVICTWNRAALLDQALTSLSSLRVPPEIDWELIVVNNHCTDNTDNIIAKHAAHLPIQRFYEPRQGLSCARNTAINAASGDLILWTDDDVLVDPDWLASHAAAAQRWPENAYFGGTIEVSYSSPPPRWVTANLGILSAMLVARVFNCPEGRFPDDEIPFGANMSFRRQVFDQYRFDPAFGRRGKSLRLGEEFGLILKLRKEGDWGIWVPSAKVKHFVPPERLTFFYLVWWAYVSGRTIASLRLESGEAYPPQRLCQIGSTALRKTCRGMLELALAREQWVHSCYTAAESAGVLVEAAARLLKRR